MNKARLPFLIAALPGCGLTLIGCASTHEYSASPGKPVMLQSADGRWVVTVHGSLNRLHAAELRQSRWEEILYGPAPPRDMRIRNPHGMCFAHGRLWVCDQGRPAVFAIDLATCKLTGEFDADDGLRCPVDVAADARGRLFVVDSTPGAILVVEPGKESRRLPNPRTDHEFAPAAVIVADEVLYAADRSSQQILRFDLGREEWMEPLSELGDPPLAAPAGLARGADGRMWISDAMTGRLWHEDGEAGTWHAAVERGRRPGELVRPTQMCTTPSGVLAVVDAGQQLVNLYTPKGAFLLSIAATSDWSGFTLPAGIECLPAAPQVLALPMAQPPSAEWIVVSDLLGAESLVWISLETAQDWRGSR